MTLGFFFTALSYLVGALAFYQAAKRKGLATDGIGVVVAVGLGFGILGAKVTQLAAEGWPAKVPFSALFDASSGGRALLGGLIFGWIAVEVTKRRLGIRRSTGDLFALALPAGEAVGRIGCFYNGCCYGIPTRVPWGVYQHGELRHPTQLYSAITAALVFLWLLYGSNHRSIVRREGDLFRLYLVAFGVTRFFIEFLRWRETVIGGLSPMQWFCLDLVGYGCLSLWLGKRKVIARA